MVTVRKPRRSSPRIVEPSDPGASTRPLLPIPPPSTTTPSVPGADACVVPSISTGLVIAGSGASVVVIVAGPSDGIANTIVPPPRLFAALIASRSVQSAAEQKPSSWSALVLTTIGADRATA